MPGTAAERGLADPFDPEQAIPKAAELLADLRARFGNLGLAAAAYNGGPQRVANWLAGSGGLPFETQIYVEIVTRHSAEDWRDGPKAAKLEAAFASPATCLATAEEIRIREPDRFAGSTLTAPWGVQLSGSFNKRAALAAYARARRRFAALLGNGEPMVIGRRAPGRGFRALLAGARPRPDPRAGESPLRGDRALRRRLRGVENMIHSADESHRCEFRPRISGFTKGFPVRK